MGAHGFIFVYDCNQRERFAEMKFWLSEVRKHATFKDAVLMLVHNKIDLPFRTDCTITTEEGKTFAEDNGLMFMATSARTGEGVRLAFEEVIRSIVESPRLIQAHRAETPRRGHSLTTSRVPDNELRRSCNR